MIENLRKYPGVIIAALVAVFIGFLLMDSERFFRRSGASAITVNGVSYDFNEFQRIGPNSRRLAEQLSSYQSLDMYRFSMALVDQKSTSADAAEKSFFVNRLLLQQAGREFGILPGDAEIQQFIRERSAFADSDPTNPAAPKEFNQERYQTFILNGLGKSGLSEADLFHLVRDFLTYEKLQSLLGMAVEVNPDDVKQFYQSMQQKVSATYLTLPLDQFTAKLQPTEEELKEYWEVRKDSYKTETRRKFSYVIGTPKYPEGAEKAPEPPKPAKEGEPIPEPSDADKKILDLRRKAELQVASDMDDLLAEIESSKGGEYENAVKKTGWEIRVTDLFTKSTMPEVLKVLTPRKTDKTLDHLLFEDLQVTTDPISKFSKSFPVGTADWFMARLDAEEESRVKTFEEAKEEVTKQWIDEKGKEALKTAADELKKKIEEAMKGGKSFADAAKDAGLTTASVESIRSGETPSGKPEAPAIYTAAQYLNPGALTEIVNTDKGAVIAVVDKREIEKDPNFETLISSGVSRFKDQAQLTAFQAWLAERNAAASVSE
jgi:hypothetical protein